MASKKSSQLRFKAKGQDQCRALILHPYPEKVLDSQERRYRLALENQARLSEQLRVFAEVDRPKYENWVQLSFAPLLLKAFEKSAVLEDLEVQLNAIAFHAETFGVSPGKSAKIIFKEREKGQEALHRFMETIEAERDPLGDPKGHSNDRRWDDDEDEKIEDLFRDIFERSDSSSRASRKAVESPSEDYFKAIYRDCVRLIHPDISGPEKFDEDLWNELQTAYSHRDFARLESLRERILSSEAKGRPSGAGEIASLRGHVERKIKELKRTIAFSKDDPAWAFSEKSQNPKHMKKLSHELRMVLMLDLRDIEDRIEIFNEELDRLRPKRSRSSPSKPSKKPLARPQTKRRSAPVTQK